MKIDNFAKNIRFISSFVMVLLLCGCASYPTPKNVIEVVKFDNQNNYLFRGSHFDKDNNIAGKWLDENNIKTIINLERCDKYNPNLFGLCVPGMPDQNDISVLETVKLDKDKLLNLNYYLLSVDNSEIDPFRYATEFDKKVSKFLAIVREEQKNGSIYVHCAAGENRTGVIIAAYQIIEKGMGKEAAIAEMNKLNDLKILRKINKYGLY